MIPPIPPIFADGEIPPEFDLSKIIHPLYKSVVRNSDGAIIGVINANANLRNDDAKRYSLVSPGSV